MNREYFKNLPQNPWTWVARKNRTHPKLDNEKPSPGDTQRLKQERIAKAAKYLGYGFGPASGAKLIIEEIGEVSEDEEDSGEYQKDRADENANGQDEKGFWEWQEGEEGIDGNEDVTGNDYTEDRQATSLLNKIKYAEKLRRREEERERKKVEDLV